MGSHTAGVLFALQFVADKIPAVDSVWDLIHTFIRIPAGAILAAAAVGHLDPKIRLLALLVGGGVALSSHSKTVTRLAANTSPEPVSNIVLSLVGDAITLGGALLMSIHPAVLFIIVLIAVVLSALLVRRLYRGMRRLFRRGAAYRSAGTPSPG